MISKKIEVFLTAFFFIVFLFLLTGSAKAECYYFCSQKVGVDCGTQGNIAWGDPYAHASCIVGDAVDTDGGWLVAYSDGGVPSCHNATNTRYCQGDACPTSIGLNGQPCKVRKNCDVTWNGLPAYPFCTSRDCTGTWDASQNQCVFCSGTKKTKRFGNSAGIDVGCNNCDGVAITPEICESGCDFAATKCDDKAPGDACGAGGTCNNLCQCVEPIVTLNCGNCELNPGEDCDVGSDKIAGTADDLDVACPGMCQSDCKCPAGNCEDTCTCKCSAQAYCTSGRCQGGLVPCGRKCDDPCTKTCECAPCTLCDLFVLAKRIVDFFVLYILIPLAVFTFIVGGFILLTSAGDPGRIGTGKKIMTATVIGLIIIFTSWLAVDTVIGLLTPAGSPFQGWKTINCGTLGGLSLIRGQACMTNPECCSHQCSLWSRACYDSNNDFPAGTECYDNTECQSNVCSGTPGHCQ